MRKSYLLFKYLMKISHRGKTMLINIYLIISVFLLIGSSFPPSWVGGNFGLDPGNYLNTSKHSQ